jgi:two-component system sensor kinase FixL
MGDLFRNLKERATKLLGSPPNVKDKDGDSVNDLIDDLVAYHLELELQNSSIIEMQEQLEVSQNKYRNLYDLAPIAYFTLNSNGIITDVNQVGASLLGINQQSLPNRSFSRYIAPESQFIFSEYYRRTFKKNMTDSCEIKMLKRGDSIFTAKLQGMATVDDGGTATLLLMVSDLTTDNQMTILAQQNQADSSQADRKRPASEMALILSKEIKQPLGVMANYINGCIRRIEGGTYEANDVLFAMRQSLLQLERASDIILRMDNFQYKNNNRQLVCIDTMIRKVIGLINYELNDFPIEIFYKKNSNVTSAMLDELHIQQVLIHLTRNAIEALRDAKVDNARLTIQVNQVSVDVAEISVIDNGPGFSDENIHQLFQPNFTTKAYGMGLGLLVSRSIVESHGGKLTAGLNPTYGAFFKFTLPLVQELEPA